MHGIETIGLDRIAVRFEETGKAASGFCAFAKGLSHEATKTAEVLAAEGIRTLTGELIAPGAAAGDKVLVEMVQVSQC